MSFVTYHGIAVPVDTIPACLPPGKRAFSEK
jgi:hypothetical protein